MTAPTEQQFLQELDKKLWTAADRLRSSLDAAVYKHAVLGLIFLKYVSDSFELRQQEVRAQLKDKKSDYFLDPEDHRTGGRSSALAQEAYEAALRAELEERNYYTAKNVFWVPALARWSNIQASAKLPIGTKITIGVGTGGRSSAHVYTMGSLGKLIDDALDAVEKENPKLKNVLNKTYTQLQIEQSNLSSLIDLIATIPFNHPGSGPGQASLNAKDILGHVYEYFLGQFALAERTDAGSTRTKSIVSPGGTTKNRASASSSLRAAPSGARLSSAHAALRLGRILSSMRPSPRLAWPNDSHACHPRPVLRGTPVVRMLEPYKGRIYDPAMGSGGFFVQSDEFIAASGDTTDNGTRRPGPRAGISVYGQESNPTTPGQARGRLWRLAAMNMAIRGIDFNFGKEPANSFTNDQHPELRADFVMANPPFNIKEWWDAKLEGDPRWQYGTPPAGNANFAWLQHMLHHLAPKGSMALLLSNGSMSSNSGGEGEIRKTLLEADLVECMVALPGQLFTNTQIPACIWFLTKHKAPSPPAPLPTGEGSKDHYRAGFDYSGLVEQARQLRKKQTPAEEAMWETLRNRQFMDLKFRRQHQFGNYIADFYCHEAKLVVELDGAPHSEEAQLKKDKKRDAYMSSMGLTVLRFPNSQWAEDPNVVLGKIAEAVHSSSPPGRGRERGARDRRGEVLFIDARNLGYMKDRVLRDFTAEDIARITGAFHNWKRGKDYADEPGFCFSAALEQIAKHDHVLTPGRYVGAGAAQEDGEPFTEKIARLGATLRVQMNDARRLDDVILANLSELENAE